LFQSAVIGQLPDSAERGKAWLGVIELGPTTTASVFGTFGQLLLPVDQSH